MVCLLYRVYNFYFLSLVIGKKSKLSHVKLVHSIQMHFVKQKNAMGNNDIFKYNIREHLFLDLRKP